MPVGKASWRQFSGGIWVAGPLENVPSGNLRRATGVYPIRSQGSILSRNGSVKLFDHTVTGVAGNVDAIVRFNNQRIFGIGVGLWVDSGGGTLTAYPLSFPSDTGAGVPAMSGNRIEFMELPSQFLSTSPNLAADLSGISAFSDQLFISGAGNAMKVNSGNSGTYWGIDAPSTSIMNALTAAPFTFGTTNSKLIDDMSNLTNRQGAGPSGFAQNNDNNRFVNGPNDTSNNSVRLDCPRDGETISTKSFAPAGYTPIDLTLFADGVHHSTDEDYIQLWVHIARPQNVQSINIKFFVQASGTFNQASFNQDPNISATSTAPYQNYYHVELSIQVVKEKRKRQLLGLGDFVPFDPENRALKRYLAQHPPDKGPDLEALQFLNPKTLAVSRNTWTKVTIPKGLFDRAGLAGTTNNTWANVVGMQLSAETNKNGNTSVWFDDVELQGGVGTRGDYLYTITYRNDNTGSRSNPPYTKATDGTITLQTFGLAAGGAVTLDRQGATLSGFPASLASGSFRGGTLGSSPALDNQVTHIEIWRTIGNGSVGKPSGGESNALFNAPQSIQMFLVDKIAVGTTTYSDVTSDYPGMFSLSGAAFLNSDQELLFDNQPPWTVNTTIGSPRQVSTMGQAVYHPPSGRVFYLDSFDSSKVYITPPGRPESVASFIQPSTKDDPIARLVVWNDTLYIITLKAAFVLEGTDVPFTTQRINGVPGTPYPTTVAATPVGFSYVAYDGLRMCDGQASQIVASDALGPIFRGSTTEGYAAFTSQNIASGSGVLNAMSTYARDEVLLTDCANSVLAYSPATDSWRAVGANQIVTLYAEQQTSVTNDHAVILAGNILGDIYSFEGVTLGEQGGIAGESTPDAFNSTSFFRIRTPGVFVSGENQGIVMMLYIECDTQGQNFTVNLILDGSTFVVTTTLNTTGKKRVEFNINQPANIAAVDIVAQGTVNPRVEFSSIELQVYESAGE